MGQLFYTNAKQFHRELFPRRLQATDSIPVAEWYNHFAEFYKLFELHEEDPEPRVDIKEEVLGRAELVAPFAEVEVAAALGRLTLGTCAGADGWTPKLFKGNGLQEAWIPLLTVLFNRCLEEGRLPHDWLIGMIRPIWKQKGSISDPYRYRPLTLCTVWYKLFVYTLMERLVPVMDPVRHVSQAGFRMGCETTTWILLTWGLLFWAKLERVLLFLLSLDLAKAFDSVHHDRLWLHLSRLGLHDRILGLLQYMYQHSNVVVKSSTGCTDTIEIKRGIRQGCPLSPLLYTAYHDNLPRLLELAPMERVTFDGVDIIAMIFADDSLLPTLSEEDITVAGTVLQQFQRDWHIATNYEKTEILAVNPGGRSEIEFGGMKIPLKQTIKYLGVVFSDGPGNVNLFASHIEGVLTSGRNAMIVLLRRVSDIGLRDPRTLLSLFKMYVLGKVQYAAPVWCLFMTEDHRRRMNALLIYFLKSVLRLPSHTLKNVVYLEMGALPVTFYLYRNTCRFWNRLMLLPYEHPTRAMLRWLQGQRETRRSWWVLFRDLVRRFQAGFGEEDQIDVKEWSTKYEEYIIEELRGGDHWRLQRFYNRIKTSFGYTRALSSFKDVSLRTGWCRFRAGLHGLEVDAGGRTTPPVPRHRRFCRYCLSLGREVVESEDHFVFHCPLYADLRRGSVVVAAQGSLFRLFNTSCQDRVARFIRRALQCRSEWMDSHGD